MPPCPCCWASWPSKRICAVIWATIVPDRFEDQSDVPILFDMVNWPDIVEKDPWLFWQLKANATAPLDQGKMTGFIANGDHMRNPEVPVERGPNDFRVLCPGRLDHLWLGRPLRRSLSDAAGRASAQGAAGAGDLRAQLGVLGLLGPSGRSRCCGAAGSSTGPTW